MYHSDSSCVYMQTFITDSQKQQLEELYEKGCSQNSPEYTFARVSFFKSLIFNSVYPSSSSDLENKGSLQLY